MAFIFQKYLFFMLSFSQPFSNFGTLCLLFSGTFLYEIGQIVGDEKLKQ